MSFSGEVKKELLKVIPEARHCRIAELAAVIDFSGKFVPAESGGENLRLRTENPDLARKVFTIIKKAFNIGVDISENGTEGTGRRSAAWAEIRDPGETARIRNAVSHRMLLSMDCCRRSYLRGAFLCSGSISAPEKYYHLEIDCPNAEAADRTRQLMKECGLDARVVLRKKSYVVYLKEGAQIVEMLGLMGANLSLMNLENIRIVREMRGTVNRQVNCETANLRKTVAASLRQVDDIRYIREHEGFSELSPALRSMAEIRLSYPDASLTELGDLMKPKVGKSGVNHRLRKLSEYAEKLRQERNEPGEWQQGTKEE